MREYTIGKNEAGQRLDKYLSKLLKEAPASFFYKMMRKKNIVLNGKKCIGRELLSEGDRVKLFFSDETIGKLGGGREGQGIRKKGQKPSDGKYPYSPLDIIYEDEDILILNKPSGMLTQKAGPRDISLNEYIIGYLLHTGSINEEQLATFKPSVCNRLDRNTSGIVLAGKSLPGTQRLSKMIKERTLQKFYITVVAGKMEKDSSIEGYLTKDPRTNKVHVDCAKPVNTVDNRKNPGFVDNVDIVDNFGNAENTGAQERFIRTDYHILKSCGDYTVLEVHLITGRPHQIRAHLAAIGHPVLGDYKYGNRRYNEAYHLKDQLLHAWRVAFPDGQEYFAAVPKEFGQFISM